MQVLAENLLIFATKADTAETAVENFNLFERLHKNTPGAVEDCLKEHGNFVWALVRKYSASTAEAEMMSRAIFADIWKYAARFDKNICDEKDFVKMIACRYLLNRKRITNYEL